MSHFTFKGRYKPRSSKKNHVGVTGERELFRINPKRAKRIREVTGWSELFEGSLNLLVPPPVVIALRHLRELYFEPPSLIDYPLGEPNFAELRGGYLYYLAELDSSDDEQDILVRRAKDRPLPYAIEVYAEVRLEEKFGFTENDVLTITVRDADLV